MLTKLPLPTRTDDSFQAFCPMWFLYIPSMENATLVGVVAAVVVAVLVFAGQGSELQGLLTNWRLPSL